MRLKEFSDKWGRTSRFYDTFINSAILVFTYCNPEETNIADTKEFLDDYFSIDNFDMSYAIEQKRVVKLKSLYDKYIVSHSNRGC